MDCKNCIRLEDKLDDLRNKQQSSNLFETLKCRCDLAETREREAKRRCIQAKREILEMATWVSSMQKERDRIKADLEDLRKKHQTLKNDYKEYRACDHKSNANRRRKRELRSQLDSNTA